MNRLFDGQSSEQRDMQIKWAKAQRYPSATGSEVHSETENGL